jgi:hypothetical protein
MNKFTFIFILIIFISTFGYSQSKIQLGVTTEGSWFMPSETITNLRTQKKDGFGAGIGIYASRNLFWRVSGDIF